MPRAAVHGTCTLCRICQAGAVYGTGFQARGEQIALGGVYKWMGTMPKATATHKEEATVRLTAEEAYALLLMCMMSPMKLDPVAEAAMRKVADACRQLRPSREQAE